MIKKWKFIKSIGLSCIFSKMYNKDEKGTSGKFWCAQGNLRCTDIIYTKYCIYRQSVVATSLISLSGILYCSCLVQPFPRHPPIKLRTIATLSLISGLSRKKKSRHWKSSPHQTPVRVHSPAGAVWSIGTGPPTRTCPQSRPLDPAQGNTTHRHFKRGHDSSRAATRPG